VGSRRNAAITTALAAVLLVLLAGEGASIPFIGPVRAWHVVLGLVIVPFVVLKLASVGRRFVGYYRREPDYLTAGPPRPLLRFLVGPATVLSTVVLFGTGVALVAFHIRHGPVVGLHKASFLIWFGAMTVHVLAHAPAVWRFVRRARFAM
jgi:hypothetical protein